VRGRLIAGAGLVLVLAAGGVAAASGGLAQTPTGAGSDAPTQSPTSSSTPLAVDTAAVEQRTMETAADLDGRLGYEGSRAVTAGTNGILTRLPELGTIIKRGDPLYELDGRVRPRLLYGSRPLWRPLGPKVSDGADVLQLEQNLRAMGYAPKGMKVNRHWDAKTTAAVKRWQKAIGRKRDGTLDGSDLAFLPGAIRVASLEASLGAAVGPGAPVLAATTAKRVVTLDIAAGRQDLAVTGQKVTVKLPDATTVPGVVRAVGRVAQAGENGGSTTIPVTIDLDPTATLPDLDAAPVTISVVTVSHPDVLTVPVNALVALLEGGYAVERIADDGTRAYVAVETGLFQDGRVEVTGSGLADGDTVVVAK
jgi:peptidoglycan hydrolase-like protein with peptidoglycan-binding domain